MIGLSERVTAHNHVLLQCLSSQRCIRRSRGQPLTQPEATRLPRSSSLPLMAGWLGGSRTFPRVSPEERAVAVHMYAQNAAIWRNRPRLPSKACKVTAALTAKAYSAAGQAASALHAMTILQVHRAKALKQMHESSTAPGMMQELCTATDFAPPGRRKSCRCPSGRRCPLSLSKSVISGSTWQR